MTGILETIAFASNFLSARAQSYPSNFCVRIQTRDLAKIRHCSADMILGGFTQSQPDIREREVRLNGDRLVKSVTRFGITPDEKRELSVNQLRTGAFWITRCQLARKRVGTPEIHRLRGVGNLFHHRIARGWIDRDYLLRCRPQLSIH